MIHGYQDAEDSRMQIFKDTVMKVISQPPHMLNHVVKKLYIDSAGYKTKFTANPLRHTNAQSNLYTSILEPVPVSSLFMTTSIVYSCPMHPEVQQSQPGSCPKCGMTLEPEIPTLEERGGLI